MERARYGWTKDGGARRTDGMDWNSEGRCRTEQSRATSTLHEMCKRRSLLAYCQLAIGRAFLIRLRRGTERASVQSVDFPRRPEDARSPVDAAPMTSPCPSLGRRQGGDAEGARSVGSSVVQLRALPVSAGRLLQTSVDSHAQICSKQALDRLCVWHLLSSRQKIIVCLPANFVQRSTASRLGAPCRGVGIRR